MPLPDARKCSLQPSSPQPNPWPMGSSQIKIECCCCTFKNCRLWQVMMLEQHPYFLQGRSRASEYRCHCGSRVWSASRVGTLPCSIRTGRRLYCSWMVHQCISVGAPPRPLTRFRLFSLRISLCFSVYPAFVRSIFFFRKEQSLFFFLLLFSPSFGRALRHELAEIQNAACENSGGIHILKKSI